jgi:hypothetical protein
MELLLVTSGFFGDVMKNDITPFFGSSVQDLPQQITIRFNTVYSHHIFIKTSPAPFSNNIRLLNQYIKKQASKE